MDIFFSLWFWFLSISITFLLGFFCGGLMMKINNRANHQDMVLVPKKIMLEVHNRCVDQDFRDKLAIYI